jgi:hypothetical protein
MGTPESILQDFKRLQLENLTLTDLTAKQREDAIKVATQAVKDIRRASKDEQKAIEKRWDGRKQYEKNAGAGRISCL